MMHQDRLEPAAIRFMLECLHDSARRSGYSEPSYQGHTPIMHTVVYLLMDWYS